MVIRVKRIYQPASAEDGVRVLVDRMWPRGLSKERARVDHWFREVSPSAPLRKWFRHDPAKWDEFKRRYFEELDQAADAVARLRGLANGQTVTLLYAAKDEEHNNAVALRQYLQQS